LSIFAAFYRLVLEAFTGPMNCIERNRPEVEMLGNAREIFQSPEGGRRNSPLGDKKIRPLVALEGGTRKPNSRADADAVSSR
jgi:hypothetical protein